MLQLGLESRTGSALRVLCLGAHCDDIEIGCGGTVLSLLERYDCVSVCWVVFGLNGRTGARGYRQRRCVSCRHCEKEIVIKGYRDGFFPYSEATRIKDDFEALKRKFAPDVVFTHCRDDRHQDHRLISDLTWNTFRNHLILEYEIPKYDGDLGQPSFFVPLDESTCSRKLHIIAQSFQSQRNKQWFDDQTFLALLRLRGMEANSSTRYAEAFYCRKAVLR